MDNEGFLKLIESVFKKHAKLTRESYLREMRFLSKFLAPKNLSDCTKGNAFAYYRFLNNSVSCWDGKPYGNKTIKRKILTLFSVYRDAQILDLVLENPFEKMALIAREIKPTNKKDPYEIQFQKVFDFIHQSRHLAHQAIFSVLYGGGLRVSEMIRLRKEDAREVCGLIGLSVVTSKTNRPRPVTLPAWASDIVWLYMKTHDSKWLFPSAKKKDQPITRKWVSNLCFKTFGTRAHAARHTHISYLLSIGVPLADVARSVGHESITSTMVYDRRILDFESSSCKKADYQRVING